MPTRVSVGLSKKAGLPNYGSIGASCHVELELDAKILEGDPESFRLQVRRAYAACRVSVEAELAQRTMGRVDHFNDDHQSRREHSGIPYRKKERTATPGQLRIIQSLSKRHGVDLQPILERLQVTEVEQLSVVAASDLIGELQRRSEVDRDA